MKIITKENEMHKKNIYLEEENKTLSIIQEPECIYPDSAGDDASDSSALIRLPEKKNERRQRYGEPLLFE